MTSSKYGQLLARLVVPALLLAVLLSTVIRAAEPPYAEWQRSSQYVTTRDGTRLAVIVYRPSVAGVPVDKPFPVIWTFSGSRRAGFDKDGQLSLTYNDRLEFTRYGYVLAVAETRGRAASFGARFAVHDQTEANDAFDLTQWFAKQPWSDGKVGMFGGSGLAQSELNLARLAPPAFKAMQVGITDFDRYDGFHRGGIPARLGGNADGSAEADLLTLPVDEDKDKTLLRAAIAEHATNTPLAKFYGEIPYRDSISSYTGDAYWLKLGAARNLAALARSRIAMNQYGGWYDSARRDTLLMFRNLKNPGILVMGPWNPASNKPESDALRVPFYDQYIKGIDQGPILPQRLKYYTMNAKAGSEWRYSDRWPLASEKRVKYYFGAGRGLGTGKGTDKTASDEYVARYDITSRAQFETRGAMDLSAADRDAKSLTYTSVPLAQDLQVTGHPVVRFWIATAASDADFFVYLESVDAAGNSTYVTDGRLRASHRALGKPFYDTAGLPWHRSHKADVKPLVAGEPAELVFDLLPTSIVLPAGSRIRVAISNADPGADFQRAATPPTVQVLRDARHASHIELPVIPVQK